MTRRGARLSRGARATPSSWTRLARNSGTNTNLSNGEKHRLCNPSRVCVPTGRRRIIESSPRFLQRTSYLTQHRRGHSGDAVHGRPAALRQVGEGGLVPGALVVRLQPGLAAGAGGAPAAGRQEPHGQPGQQQRGLGQPGAGQPGGRLPVL